MNPSKQAKDAGLPSLAYISRTSGESRGTLGNWSVYKPWLFDAVIQKCKKIYDKEKEDAEPRQRT